MEHIPLVLRALGRMEGQLESMEHTLEKVRLTITDAETRLRNLEHQNSLWKGGLGVVMLLTTILSAFIPLLF
jgi:hypothetical protein